MLRITDSRLYINLQILFNPVEESMEFSIINYESQLNTIVFSGVSVSFFLSWVLFDDIKYLSNSPYFCRYSIKIGIKFILAFSTTESDYTSIV